VAARALGVETKPLFRTGPDGGAPEPPRRRARAVGGADRSPVEAQRVTTQRTDHGSARLTD